MSDSRRLAQRGERCLPLWQALLVKGLRAASGTVARRGGGAAARRGGVPAAVARSRVAAHARPVAAVAAALMLAALVAMQAQPSMSALTAPAPPPSEQTCGSSSLNGPSSPPPGAVTVAAGDDSGVNFTTPGAVYWFAPGTHTVGSGPFSQIAPGNNSTFTGAPGAIINGQHLNQFAFISNNTNVTIEYLTIENFIPPGSQGAVNTNSAPDWTVEYSTLQDNIPGAAMMLGTGSVVSGDCLTENGEYGFNGYSVTDVSTLTGGPSNVTLTGNEISFNDTCNWENVTVFPITPPAGCGTPGFNGCGCSGAGKFWEVDGATVTGNYVHDNYSTGLWADTNDVGFTFTGNYISGNYDNGITYEISYNTLISGNVFVRNGIGAGPTNPGFPTGAVYLSESGSDPRVAGPYGTVLSVTDNQFYDNWGGVVLWENANRFCTSSANSSTGSCTLVARGEANYTTCQTSLRAPARPVTGPAPPGRGSRGGRGSGHGQAFIQLINQEPYLSDCRWKTQNVQVSGNVFDYSPAAIGPTCTAASECGFNGLFSEFGTYPPYLGFVVPNSITFSQNNLFTGNTYCGPWQFLVYQQGTDDDFATWQAPPYSQDPGSTMNGQACFQSVPPSQPGAPRRAVTVPIFAGRR